MVWHVVQGGGLATPPGPCGRWQPRHPLASLPCAEVASFAWHDAQDTRLLAPECG